MNKIIIMSEQPKWLAKILNGDKTIEIRKSMPKCALPIDVYLYCTKDKPYLYENWDGCCYKLTRAKTWQERANEEDYTSVEMFHLEDYGGELNGKVVAKFTLKHVSTCLNTDYGNEEILKNACLTKQKLDDYVGKRKFFAWHIDKLEIFDKPKELSEFYKQKPNKIIDAVEKMFNDLTKYRVIKAPQNWRYAYVKED